MFGAPISTCIPHSREARAAGKTKYSVPKMVRFAWDAAVSFSTLPLRLVAAAGGLISVVALGYGAWVIAEDLIYGIKVPGYPTIVVSIMFFSGVQLLSLGAKVQKVLELKDRLTLSGRRRDG